jgi:hypothetical protein
MKSASISFTLRAFALAFIWAIAAMQARAAEPVGVTAIDARTGVVTAVNGARSLTVQFKVANAVTVKALKVGQVVSADVGAKKVSINHQEPCCAIVGVKNGAAGSQTGAVGSAAMNAGNDPLGSGGVPRRMTKVDLPNCGTCAGDCKVCSDWNQECRCTLISSGSSPGSQDDVYSCHCTGPDPKMPGSK